MPWGSRGRVYAVDVDPDMLDYLKARTRSEQRTNVEVVRARFDDPNLPDAEIDLIFTSNTYHHLEDRPAYFRRVLADLRPNGRVAIVDFGEASRLGLVRPSGGALDPEAPDHRRDGAGGLSPGLRPRGCWSARASWSSPPSTGSADPIYPPTSS